MKGDTEKDEHVGFHTEAGPTFRIGNGIKPEIDALSFQLGLNCTRAAEYHENETKPKAYVRSVNCIKCICKHLF